MEARNEFIYKACRDPYFKALADVTDVEIKGLRETQTILLRQISELKAEARAREEGLSDQIKTLSMLICDKPELVEKVQLECAARKYSRDFKPILDDENYDSLDMVVSSGLLKLPHTDEILARFVEAVHTFGLPDPFPEKYNRPALWDIMDWAARNGVRFSDGWSFIQGQTNSALKGETLPQFYADGVVPDMWASQLQAEEDSKS